MRTDIVCIRRACIESSEVRDSHQAYREPAERNSGVLLDECKMGTPKDYGSTGSISCTLERLKREVPELFDPRPVFVVPDTSMIMPMPTFAEVIEICERVESQMRPRLSDLLELMRR